MIYKERLFKILRFPYVSEKTSTVLEKNNVVVFRVPRYATKLDIKNAVVMLFTVKINSVNTAIVTKKNKRSSDNVGHRRRSGWKKAYVILKKGYKIDFMQK